MIYLYRSFRIKILTSLEAFCSYLNSLYFLWFLFCSSIFWKLQDNGISRNFLQFCHCQLWLHLVNVGSFLLSNEYTENDNNTFTFHIESLLICYKIVRFCFLGFVVQFAHSSWNEVVVACTSGVVFTDILTFKRGSYHKFFKRVTLESFTRYWSFNRLALPICGLNSIHSGY